MSTNTQDHLNCSRPRTQCISHLGLHKQTTNPIHQASIPFRNRYLVSQLPPMTERKDETKTHAEVSCFFASFNFLTAFIKSSCTIASLFVSLLHVLSSFVKWQGRQTDDLGAITMTRTRSNGLTAYDRKPDGHDEVDGLAA